ncbi:MAG: NAD(P)-dependent oxidoreductase, partial [Gemmatimonadetes bacterium]|nr:NAD(P)-dependent oxidoreductase [Gemmatimonadota bacterium]
MRIGFAGLGAIGRPMAARLAANHDLTVWNRTGSVAEAFAATHEVAVAPTPRELAEGSEVLFTCLPSSREVVALLDGPDGLEAGLQPGTLVIDCTSGDPERSRQIAGRLRERGVALVDAPVSGGVVGAEAGTLTAMVGAEGEDFDRARGVLDVFCGTILHVGPIGAGHALKAVSNAILASNIIAVAEGMTAAVKAGVPAATALEVLNASNARSFASMELVPQRALTRAWPKTFKLALLDKDVKNAIAVIDDAGLEARLLRTVSALLSKARTELGEEADHVEVVKLVEQEAGVELRG